MRLIDWVYINWDIQLPNKLYDVICVFKRLKMDNFRKQTGKYMLIGWLIFPGHEFTYAGHGIQLAPNKEIVYTDNI